MARALTSPLSSFIGRRSELAALERLGRSERLLTLVGPGGVGKTRLAAELSARAARRGELVGTAELAPIKDPSSIGAAAAAAFGVAGGAGALNAWLEDRAALLVFDSCEHLAGGVAVVAAQLLATAPGLRILVTSRVPLGLASERVRAIPPLSLPEDDHAGWERSDAVRLFVERARGSVPRFAADAQTGMQIVQICRKLDGLPLAIELAAKTLANVSLEDVERAVAEPLELGRDVTRSSPGDVIRASIARSYAALGERERRAFRRLGIFSGGFTREAAEQVCADDATAREDVLPLLASLVEKSLLEVDRERMGRYRMLELIREFALERLRESDELDSAERQRAEHIAGLFQEFDLRASTTGSGPNVGRIVGDHPNVRGAMAWALAHDLDIARQIAAKVWPVYIIVGPGIDPAEIEGWIERTLLADAAADAARARMLLALAHIRSAARDPTAARRYGEDALALSRAVGDHQATGGAYRLLGMIAQAAGDLALATEHYTAALEEFRTAQMGAPQAWALALRAAARSLAGDGTGAKADLAEATSLVGPSTFPRAFAIVKTLEGEHYARYGALEDARRCFEECVAVYRQAGPGVVSLARVLDGIADLAARSAQWERAVTLAGAAEAIASRSGEGWPAGPTPSLEQATRALGSRAAAAREQGRRASAKHAIAIALGERPEGRELSRREREVAGLLAEGLTSREIADRLGISERTAENHVEHMLMKLGVRSRVQIVRWAVEESRSAG